MLFRCLYLQLPMPTPQVPTQVYQNLILCVKFIFWFQCRQQLEEKKKEKQKEKSLVDQNTK